MFNCPPMPGWIELNCGNGFTISKNVFASLNGGAPLSVTRTVIALVPGAAAFVVVQVKAPVGEIVASTGAPGSRLNVSVWYAESTSLAVAVNAIVWPRGTARLPIAFRAGAVFGIPFGAPGVGVGMK